MKCPRCQSSITAAPDPEGFLTCPGCGARLRSRSAPATVGALNARSARPRRRWRTDRTDEILGVLTRLDPDAERFPDAVNPNSTLPARHAAAAHPAAGLAGSAGGPGRRASAAGAAAGGRPAPRVMRAPRDVPREAGDDVPAPAKRPATLEALMAEVQALRHLQEETLALLRSGGGSQRAMRARLRRRRTSSACRRRRPCAPAGARRSCSSTTTARPGEQTEAVLDARGDPASRRGRRTHRAGRHRRRQARRRS